MLPRRPRRAALLALSTGAAIVVTCLIGAPQTTPPANRPPVADAGGPYAVLAGQPVLLSALNSTDRDGDQLVFGWNLGDGTAAAGVTPEHTYESAGTYAVTLLASDRKGGLASATTTVVVMREAPGNHPPSVVHNGPYVSIVNQPLLMDASASTDSDNDGLSFAWSFGDGTSEVGSTTTSHAYEKPGTYIVRLMVTDGNGGTTSRVTAAVVAPQAAARNLPPVAFTNASKQTVYTGIPVTVDARNSSDPDGNPLTFTWIFDDDEVVRTPWTAKVFRTAGIHHVTMIVSDGRGGTDLSTFEIEVARTETNKAPVAMSGGPYKGRVGTAIAFDADGSRDPDGDELTYIWEFGDGTKESGRSVRHVYTSEGTFGARVLVSDDNGDTTVASTSVVVTSANAATRPVPDANSGGRYSGTTAAAITLTGNAGTNAGTGISYAWSFGDGATGAGPNVSHKYAAPGDYYAILLVTNAQGGASASLVKVSVDRP